MEMRREIVYDIQCGRRSPPSTVVVADCRRETERSFSRNKNQNFTARRIVVDCLDRTYEPGFRRFLLADATHPGISNEHNEDTTEDGGALLMKELADPLAFSWALECVLSRAFQLPSINTRRPSFEDVDDNHDVPARAPELEAPAPGDARMALLPLIDSMNHYSRIPTTMYWEEDGESLSVAGECR